MKQNKESNNQNGNSSQPRQSKKEQAKRIPQRFSQTGLPPLASPQMNQQQENPRVSGLKKIRQQNLKIKQVQTICQLIENGEPPPNEKQTSKIKSLHYTRRSMDFKQTNLDKEELKTNIQPNNQHQTFSFDIQSQQKVGYVQKLKKQVSDILMDVGSPDTWKFENPVLTLHKRTLKQIAEAENEESVIKDEINVFKIPYNLTNFSEKSPIVVQNKNRLTEMKNASSHSSSNSQKNLNFQLSGSEKISSSQTDGSSKAFKIGESGNTDFQELETTEFQKEWMKKSWRQGEFLGAGSFGQVFQAMDIVSGQLFALKKIDLKQHFDEQDLELLQKELLLMRRMAHPHIIKYMGHELTENEIYIYLEYMSQGSLTSIINRFGPLKEETIKIYSKQVLEALAYLHEKKVVHRDIKGANILVDTDGTVKVADFGCSSQMEKTMTLFRDQDKAAVGSLKGSIPWMPPEVITQTNYGTSADIWSFGCTVIEMATGLIPWSECDFDNPIAAILKIGLEDGIPSIPEDLSECLKSFIKGCLQRDPLLRPTANQLLQHQFLFN